MTVPTSVLFVDHNSRFVSIMIQNITVLFPVPYRRPGPDRSNLLKNLSTPLLVRMAAIAVGYASAMVTILDRIRFPLTLRCVSKI